MKLALLTGLALALSVVAQAADPAPQPNAATAAEAAALLKTDIDKFSYSVGLGWGTSMRQQHVDVAPEILLRGLRDGLSNAAPLMSTNEIQQIQEQMRKIIYAKR